MTLFKIALRNVLKNRRRSLITTLAIAFGFMAVAMFKGYTHNSYEKMSYGAVFREAPGHLVLFKRGYLEEGKLRPEEYMISIEELNKIELLMQDYENAIWWAPKLTLTGLITNGDTSTIFIADAIAPESESDLWEHYSYTGGRVTEALPSTISNPAFLASQLARLLQLEVGDDAVLMATTRWGQMNAVDVHVAQIGKSLSDATDDKYIRIPLAVAQNLYDFDGADRFCILLRDRSLVPIARRDIEQSARTLEIDVEVKSWDELSIYYQKVRGFLDVVFLFIFTIVMIIVVMGIFNTMSMAIYERMREIGTLRAIGLKPAGILAMISIEGGILGLAGCSLGCLFTAVGYTILKLSNLTYSPPGIAEKVTVEIDFVAGTLVYSFLFFIALSILSAAIPARRASKQNIIDSLGHV